MCQVSQMTNERQQLLDQISELSDKSSNLEAKVESDRNETLQVSQHCCNTVLTETFSVHRDIPATQCVHRHCHDTANTGGWLLRFWDGAGVFGGA